MKNFLLPGAILLLSLSIIYCGYQIREYNVNKSNEMVPITSLNEDVGLLKLEDTAKYLSMSTEELKKILILDDAARMQGGSYDVYRYIPYIEVHGKKYFQKAELEEWIKYNTRVHTEYN